MTMLFAKRRPLVAALALAAMTLTSASAFAAQPARHDDHRQAGPSHDRPEFSPNESRSVRDYYRSHKWDAKPLPHGRSYTVGRKVPASYRRPLPPDLRRNFPQRPGYEPYIVGDNVVLIAVATGVIVDILSQVH
jgi:Ni/Co efflux regulator RcnB